MSVAPQIMTKGIIKISKVNRKSQLLLQGKTLMCMWGGEGGALFCKSNNKQQNKS